MLLDWYVLYPSPSLFIPLFFLSLSLFLSTPPRPFLEYSCGVDGCKVVCESWSLLWKHKSEDHKHKEGRD